MMKAVRSKDGKAEIALRKELWRRGLRYRLHQRDLIGRPDIVFPKARVALFIDGDYWHARGIVENGVDAFRATLRTERREWWIRKLTRNVERDALVNETLASQGWIVVRFWESDIKADPSSCASAVERIVRKKKKR